MHRKTVLTCSLLLFPLASALLLGLARPAEVRATDVPAIDDDCSTLGAKTSDYYHISTQATDVGFGADGRFLSTYAATAAPTSSTMWSDYGYLQYAIAGQNYLNVICDESAALGAPLVWANTANVLVDAVSTVEQTSTNWTRRTYTYVLPSTTDWIRIIPVAYDKDGTGATANWSQQITEVKISYLAGIDDDCSTPGAKTSDAYSIGTQSTDIGFGVDGRFYSTYAATAAPTSSTMWSDYGYLQYAVTGQNLLTVICDEGTNMGAPLVWANTVNQLLSVNNKTETSSTNWMRRTYVYILPATTDWIRIIPVAYDDGTGNTGNWSQQITEVKIDIVGTLPAADSKPTPETVTKIDDPCDVLTGNTLLADFYHVDAKSIDNDGRYVAWTGATVEPTAATWWGENYGYVQYTATQQNLLTAVCYIADAAVGYLPPLFVYAGANNQLAKVSVNNTIAGTSANGFTSVTYQYLLTGQTQIRCIIPSYDAPDGKFSHDAFQISNIKMEYSDTLPTADPVDTSMDAKKAEMDTYLATYKAADYSDANWALIQYLVTIAKYDIGKAADATAADAVIAAAKEKIQAVKTLAVEKQEAKDAEVKRLTDFVATLNETDYTAENWAKIQKLVSDATTEIGTLDDITQIKQVVDDTIADIQAVPVKEVPTSSTPTSSTPTSSTPTSSTPTPTSSTPTPTSSSGTGKTSGCGGCSGDVGTALGVTISSLVVIGLLFLRRKKVN